MKSFLVLLCSLLLFSALGVALCQASPVQMTFGKTGVTAFLSGHRSVAGRRFQVKSAQLSQWDGITITDADIAGGRRTVDVQRSTVTWNYAWGNAACRYTVDGNRLEMVMTVSNTSRRAVALRGVAAAGAAIPRRRHAGMAAAQRQ